MKKTVRINDGTVIELNTRKTIRQGAFIGYITIITDNRGHRLETFHVSDVKPRLAMDSAYVRFIKEYY